MRGSLDGTEHGAKEKSLIIVLFALQAPLLAELVRRFADPSAYWLLASDLLMILTFMFVASGSVLGHWRRQMMILAGLVCYAVISIGFRGLPLALIYVGTRPFVMGLISAMLAHYLVEGEAGIRPLIWVALLWSALITVFAVIQVVLGIDDQVNSLPVGVNAIDEGIGGYSEIGETVFGLFRPTSIFFHTGKFGQVAFFLALIPALFVWSKVKPQPFVRWLLQSLTVLGFAAVLLSGQRAAFAFIAIALAVNALGRFNIGSTVSILGWGVCLMIALGLIGGEDLISSVVERYSGLMADSVGRLDNSAQFSEVLGAAGIFGEGVGLYSFGAGNFMVGREFVTEQGWIRLLAEWGVSGFALLFAFLLSVLVSCRNRSDYEKKDHSTDVLRFASLSIALSLAIWCFTHDVIANTLTVQIAFSVFGATRGWISRQRNGGLGDKV